MQAAPHILIVDDHREIRDLVSRALSREGLRVSVAADGRAMRKVLADSRIDLVLLDLMLPGEDGLSLCRALRAESSVPIIMLTAKGDEVDRVIGLEMGADDYLPKPFGSRELIARIKAVLRRSRDKAAEPDTDRRAQRYHFGRWQLDTGARELLRDDGVTARACSGRIESTSIPFDDFLSPHPEERSEGSRLEGRGRATRCLRPSFEAAASPPRRMRWEFGCGPRKPKNSQPLARE